MPDTNDLSTDSAVSQLTVDLCRELYDRFVMGGWVPQDAHSQTEAMIRQHFTPPAADAGPRQPKVVSVAYCGNPRVKLIKPLLLSIEKDDESGQFVATLARGDSDEWGHGDTESSAMEDFSRCAAESYMYLRDNPDDKLSAHLAKEKSILAEYFELRDALRKYGSHSINCKYNNIWAPYCECGWAEASRLLGGESNG